MKKTIAALCMSVLLIAAFAGCGSGMRDGGYAPGDMIADEDYGEESYEEIVERGFVDAGVKPDSTFSLDANTAAYSIMRSSVESGVRVPKDSVRIEEYINYFGYDSYPAPAKGEGLALNSSLFDCPWNAEHKLLRVGLRTEAVEYSDTYNNLVFLIDVSGSMNSANKLGLVKESLHILTESLGEQDRISIVTYASGTKTVLEGARGTDRNRILRAVDGLRAGGATSGESGIERAYDVATKHFIRGGNNRVILATDGDFNVGISSPEALKGFIAEKRESGIYLSVLGYGRGNLKDSVMEALARNGNGNYAYIDSREEAERKLSDGINGMIRTVARDAKALVSFNPETVSKYRLIGYENKTITFEEWEDDLTDTGDIGSGLVVTALYEVVPAAGAAENGRAALFAVRFKDALDTSSQEVLQRTLAVSWTEASQPSEDDRFIACVAEYGLLLRESVYAGDASFPNVRERLASLPGPYLGDPLRKEFAGLVEKAERIYG